MEHKKETEKQFCPHCGYTEYDTQTGICGNCRFRFDEEDTETTDIVVDTYMLTEAFAPFAVKPNCLWKALCAECAGGFTTWFRLMTPIGKADKI